jgi:hypothetical protein
MRHAPAAARGLCLRVQIERVHEAGLEHAAQRPDLALGRLAPLVRAGVAVPALREALAVGAPAATVSGKHRADAALVRVSARDDRLVVEPDEHCLLRLDREHVHGGS